MALKLIHVGVGGRGSHWLEFAAQRDDVESVACVDIDEAALEQAGQQFSCATYTDMDLAFSEVEADGVVIASPSHLHGAHASAAIKAGFGALVEKPLATTLTEAVDVVRLAADLGRPLMVAENYRFFQAERTLRHALEKDLIGRIRSAVCIDRRDQPPDTQGDWVKTMEQPFLTEISVHHFDSFRYLFGRRPTSVWARAHNPPGSAYDQNGAAESLLEFEDDLPVQYSGSFVGSRFEFELAIEGESGELRTNRSQVWYRNRSESKFRVLDPIAVPEGEALRYPYAGMVSILAQFRDALAGQSEPETSGRDNLWTLAMYTAAKESCDTGREISIDSVFSPELQVKAGLAESPLNSPHPA